MTRIAFVTNICSHYRVKTFETLAKYEDTHYYFYSAGDEWYWDQSHGVSYGAFNYEYLPGFKIGRSRIAYTLPQQLWRGRYDVYLKCINGRFALPVTYLIARLRGKPFVLWTGIWMRLQSPTHRLIWPLTRYIYRHADSIVTYGTHVKQYLIDEGIAPEKVFSAHHVVHNPDYNQPVSEDVIQALRTRLNIRPEQKVILFIGRLVEVKGLPYLLQAIAQLDDSQSVVVLVGQGEQQVILQEQARQLGIGDRVRFAHYVKPKDTTAYYAMAWVHVLPSITTQVERETWGLVVNEAFNQGVPTVVTTAVGAAAGGLVEDGVNGFIVPERDSTALAARLNSILSDHKLRQKLSAAASEKIAHWDNEAMIADFRKAIHHAVKQHPSNKKG